jgi:four helix bundle protein
LVSETTISRDIQARTFDFALRILRLCQHLERKPGAGRRLVGQLLRAGTSVGANVEEAAASESKAEFIYKRSISLRECRETIYWLRLLAAADLVTPAQIDPLISEAQQIAAILAKSIITTKRNLRK